MIEPSTFLDIAEKAGIEPVLSRDDDVAVVEDEDEDVTEDLRNAQEINKSIGNGGRFQDAKITNVNPASVGPNIKKQLDTLDTSKLRESILQKQQSNGSLLDRGGK